MWKGGIFKYTLYSEASIVFLKSSLVSEDPPMKFHEASRAIMDSTGQAQMTENIIH